MMGADKKKKINEAREKARVIFLSVCDVLYCRVLKSRWPNLSLVGWEGFKNRSIGMAGTNPSATLQKEERRWSCRMGRSSL